MKSRFILFRRGGVYYCEDTTTRKQSSLKTRDKTEAVTVLNARNESFRQPRLNIQIARAYLTAKRSGYERPHVAGCDGPDADPRQTRHANPLRSRHEMAPKLWPKPQFKPKRGITPDEHQRILAAEKNPERNLFYPLLWEVGASQSDAAALTAENLDWSSRTLTYFRMKTGEQAQMAISKRLAAILNHLPTEGPLFPKLSQAGGNTRAADFRWLCKRLKIEGVSLHSYRYAWAERAKTCGYPERFAQAALGHNSQAVHRAYAKKAQVLSPSLEEYENKLSAGGRGASGMVATVA